MDTLKHLFQYHLEKRTYLRVFLRIYRDKNHNEHAYILTRYGYKSVMR